MVSVKECKLGTTYLCFLHVKSAWNCDCTSELSNTQPLIHIKRARKLTFISCPPLFTITSTISVVCLNKQINKNYRGPRYLPLYCILHGIVTVSPTLTFMVCPPLFTILSTISVVRLNKQINKKDRSPGFCPRVYFWYLPLFCILHGIVTVSPTLTFMVCPP